MPLSFASTGGGSGGRDGKCEDASHGYYYSWMRAATRERFCEARSEPLAWPDLAIRVISFAGRRASDPSKPRSAGCAKLVKPCARYFSPRCRFPGCASSASSASSASNLRPSSAALGHTPAFGSLLLDLCCSSLVQAICVSIDSFESKNSNLVLGVEGLNDMNGSRRPAWPAGGWVKQARRVPSVSGKQDEFAPHSGCWTRGSCPRSRVSSALNPLPWLLRPNVQSPTLKFPTQALSRAAPMALGPWGALQAQQDALPCFPTRRSKGCSPVSTSALDRSVLGFQA